MPEQTQDESVLKGENDILIVSNITNEDFTVSWGGTPFTVKARKSRHMPRSLALHFAKHLTDKILIERNPKKPALNDEAKRRELAEQILKEEAEEYIVPRPDTLTEKVDKMNDFYNEKTEESKAEGDKLQEKKSGEEGKEESDDFEGLEDEKKVARPDTDKEREELYLKAESAGLVVDHKLVALSKDELRETLENL